MKSIYYLLIIIGLFAQSCGSRRSAQTISQKPVENKKDISGKPAKGVIKKYESIVGVDIKKRSYTTYYFIDNWYGTPYCYGGANTRCTDCSGFTYNFYDVVYKTKIPRSADKQMDETRKVKMRKLKEGDLVFFNTMKSGNKASHVGVYLGNYKFVHASSSKGVRIDDLKSDYYDKTFIRGGRLAVK